jgi:hypothetical protein
MKPEQPVSSPAPSVVGLHTGGKVNAACVAELRELLAQAEAGEIVGFVTVTMRADMTASQTIAGMVGGSMMVGQLRIAETDLIALTIRGRGE